MNKEKKFALSGAEGIVPKLRFPEFKADGGWKEREFYKIGEFIGGGTPSTSNPEFWNGNIQWYTPTEVKNGILKPSLRTITKLGLKKSSAKILPKGTILITTRATIGDVAITENECTTNQGFQSLVVNETEFNVFWLYWIIRFKNELIKRCSGSTFKEIGKTDIKSIPTFSPINKDEQQKIASCLSSLDDVITAETEKLDLLQDHKKGLLQQLFPNSLNHDSKRLKDDLDFQNSKKSSHQANPKNQGADNIPQFRFPEFENDGDWEEKRLDEIAKVVTGSTPKTSDSENYGGNKLFVSPADISEDRYIIKTGKTLSEKGFSKSRIIPANSILFVCIGSTIGKLAQNKIECTTNQQINSLIPFKDNSNDFIYSLLENNSNYIASLSAQQAVPLINKSEFSSVKLHFPTNPKEQQKIANSLSSADNLIAAQTQKIELLQEHKKGLLQQLFPNVNELAI